MQAFQTFRQYIQVTNDPLWYSHPILKWIMLSLLLSTWTTVRRGISVETLLLAVRDEIPSMLHSFSQVNGRLFKYSRARFWDVQYSSCEPRCDNCIYLILISWTFWVLIPSSSESVQRFWSNMLPPFQGRKRKQKTSKIRQQADLRLPLTCVCFFTLLILLPWRWRQLFLPKHWILPELQGVTNQTTMLFIAIWVTNSNAVYLILVYLTH
jgi:hypothetical protein